MLVENELKKLALSIPALGEVSSKSEIKKPHEEVVFLGLSIYEQRNGQYAKRIPNTAFSDLATRIDADVSFENFETKGNRNSKSFSEYNNWFSSMIRGYCAAYSGATNLAHFEDHAKKLAEAAKKKLLLQVFGQDTLDSLGDRERKFLGIN
jgi:hypothetical protein